MITDTHSPLFWKRFDDDRDEVIARAKAAGVERMLVVGTTLETSKSSFELAAKHEGLFPTAGVHPHDVEEPWDAVREEVSALCALKECVAVGETGLDYFRDYSPLEAQRDWFRWHLELATKLDKPVIIHCREANEDTVRILSEYPDARGVMHCYVMARTISAHSIITGIAPTLAGFFMRI